MGNVNKTKSGQSTDDLYVSNWVHYQSLAFLQPVMKSSSSKNTLKQSNEDQDEIEYTDVKIASGSKKKTLPERKIELLTKCTDAIASSTPKESQGTKRLAFASYIEEKLSGFNKRQRIIAEKRINDVLFEIEMSSGNETIDRNIQPFQNVQPIQIPYGNIQNPYSMQNVGASASSTYQMENVPTRHNHTWIFLTVQSNNVK